MGYVTSQGALESVPEDRMHLVQFTDCENASTYGCCVTVTQVLQVYDLCERTRKWMIRETYTFPFCFVAHGLSGASFSRPVACSCCSQARNP